jgi:hypothetical protein
MEAEQRTAVAAFDIDHAIEQEVTQRRKHLPDGAPCDHADWLTL